MKFSNSELYYTVGSYSSIVYCTKHKMLKILSKLKEIKNNLHIKVFYNLVKTTIKLLYLLFFILIIIVFN